MPSEIAFEIFYPMIKIWQIYIYLMTATRGKITFFIYITIQSKFISTPASLPAKEKGPLSIVGSLEKSLMKQIMKRLSCC